MQMKIKEDRNIMFKNSKKVIKMKSHLIQKVENIFYTKNKTKKEAERNDMITS